MSQTQIEMDGAFNSFTGADIQAIITYNTSQGSGQLSLGTLSSVTVSVVREVNPMWALGDSTFKSISKGKRSITGTMTFMVLDKDALTKEVFGGTNFKHSGFGNVKAGEFGSTKDVSGTFTDDTLARQNLSNIMNSNMELDYADQLPPFNIIITFVNEHGSASVASLLGVSIVSQGIGWSMHDLESDQAYAYIARRYVPMQSMRNQVNLYGPPSQGR